MTYNRKEYLKHKEAIHDRELASPAENAVLVLEGRGDHGENNKDRCGGDSNDGMDLERDSIKNKKTKSIPKVPDSESGMLLWTKWAGPHLMLRP